MTSPYLAGDLARDEGLRLKAYPDPLSPRGRELAKPMLERCEGWAKLPGDPWTIGHGHTGPDVHEGLVWTLEQCNAALKADIAEAESCLDHAIPWWRQLSDYRQDVLANMAFNLGWTKLSAFHHFLAALDQGDYDDAATEMMASAWAREVGARARRLATQMRTGVRS